MANANKSRGSRFELDLERALQEAGLAAVRPRQTGRYDIGDLHVEADVVVQAKDWADMPAGARAGVKGAELQAVHARRKIPVAAVKQRGRHARDALIVMTIATFAELLKSRRPS